MAPPKLALTLRIGVTGHRPNRFNEAAQGVVRHSLAKVFATIGSAAAAIAKRELDVFEGRPPEIRVVSALAEGADRVVADAGLKAGFVLDVILPFAASEYEKDFSTADSKTAFQELFGRARAKLILPGERSPVDPALAERAYESVGLMTLRQCDLVIAVWDGKEAAGRGGTEDIVQHAVESGRPVLRFDQFGNGPFLLEADAGKPSDARDLAARASVRADAQAITAIIERLCAPPRRAGKEDKTSNSETMARGHLNQYLREHEKRLTFFAFPYPLLLACFSKKKGFWRALFLPGYIEDAETNWAEYWTALKDDNPLAAPIREKIMRRFAWADGLANYYGLFHRSGYIANYALAAVAVLCAAIIEYWKLSEAWTTAELSAIAIIAAATIFGRCRSWHSRWVDYRQLSAQLRHLRALVLTGSTAFESRQSHTGEEGRPGTQWVEWYCRMTAREIGVLDLAIDRDYLDTARRAIAEGEIADQFKYHKKNAARMASVETGLDWLSNGAFVATLLICGMEVFFWWFEMAWPTTLEPLREALPLITIVLPAFGAALFGIRTQGDFAGSAERSISMAAQLEKLLEDLRRNKEISFAELSALTEHAILLMSSELGDWGFVYRGRPLTLPS